MNSPEIFKQISQELNLLPLSLQFQVKEYVHHLVAENQKPKNDFLKLAGTISKEEAAELTRIIEEGCGKIDPNGW